MKFPQYWSELLEIPFNYLFTMLHRTTATESTPSNRRENKSGWGIYIDADNQSSSRNPIRVAFEKRSWDWIQNSVAKFCYQLEKLFKRLFLKAKPSPRATLSSRCQLQMKRNRFSSTTVIKQTLHLNSRSPRFFLLLSSRLIAQLCNFLLIEFLFIPSPW